MKIVFVLNERFKQKTTETTEVHYRLEFMKLNMSIIKKMKLIGIYYKTDEVR